MRRGLPGKTVIVLGAGASATDGAPLQSELFREYFLALQSESKEGKSSAAPHEWDVEIAAFFKDFFGISALENEDHIRATVFPTFEEILGILELASSSGESFQGWHGRTLTSGSGSRLQHIHDLLVFSIAEVLKHKLENSGTHHQSLISELIEGNWLKDTTFISFNYDLLLDVAIADSSKRPSIDYGVSFGNPGRASDGNVVPVFKLHGSLNWLFCPTCRKLDGSKLEKLVVFLKKNPTLADCSQCGTPRVPLVIPPTYFKTLSNLHLRMIWDRAEQSCLDTNRLVFCGYSFPDADIHVRYLLKRIERRWGNDQSKFPDIFVVNWHDHKSREVAEQEAARYRRFFSAKEKVHYTNISFEDFVDEPTLIRDKKRWTL